MKKIMFNDRYGLTQAVLDGRKTMTRRIVPEQILKKVEEYQDEYYNAALATISEKDAILSIATYEYRHRFPQVGEVVAIAQAYKECGNDILIKWHHKTDIALLAFKKMKGWYNKMFVKAKLMPHHIRITNIKIERLQDISDEDCLREGVIKRGEFFSVQNVGGGYNTARGMFEWLIDEVSGKGTWERNPYIFVYEFELVD